MSHGAGIVAKLAETHDDGPTRDIEFLDGPFVQLGPLDPLCGRQLIDVSDVADRREDDVVPMSPVGKGVRHDAPKLSPSQLAIYFPVDIAEAASPFCCISCHVIVLFLASSVFE